MRQQTGIRQTPMLSHPGSQTDCQNNVALEQPHEGPPVYSVAGWGLEGDGICRLTITSARGIHCCKSG